MVLLLLLVIRQHRSQKILLLIASYYFYACWDWRFLSLIWISTLVDFYAGWAMGSSDSDRRRRLLLAASIVTNLTILGVFKYFDFFIEPFIALIDPLGMHTASLNIILPVGISFYTFQSMSYTIDVYRRNLPVCHDLFDFALFVAFFPQLVAGPIVRAAQFLPQLQTPRRFSGDAMLSGFRLFGLGYVKKLLIADRLAFFVDGVFEHPGSFSSATLWLAVVCYAVQIYCDFSGYSDMAIGTARMLGFELPENFRHPYIATSLVDFWRRWHISLSTWLHDYLYISLGGNRQGALRTALNIMVTMVLGGLWHGADWTFVAWGALHAVALIVNKLLLAPRTGTSGSMASTTRKWLGWMASLLVVNLGWVFFRSHTVTDAVTILGGMFGGATGDNWYPPLAIVALMVIGLTHGFHATRFPQRTELLPHRKWYTPAILISLMLLIQLLQEQDYTPFIYFQF